MAVVLFSVSFFSFVSTQRVDETNFFVPLSFFFFLSLFDG